MQVHKRHAGDAAKLQETINQVSLALRYCSQGGLVGGRKVCLRPHLFRGPRGPHSYIIKKGALTKI